MKLLVHKLFVYFRERFQLVTLSLHEANPGHHFHFASVSENNDIPMFRKNFPGGTAPVPSTFPSFTAFTEGWGLYAETLGYDMELFTDPMQR